MQGYQYITIIGNEVYFNIQFGGRFSTVESSKLQVLGANTCQTSAELKKTNAVEILQDIEKAIQNNKNNPILIQNLSSLRERIYPTAALQSREFLRKKENRPLSYVSRYDIKKPGAVFPGLGGYVQEAHVCRLNQEVKEPSFTLPKYKKTLKEEMLDIFKDTSKLRPNYTVKKRLDFVCKECLSCARKVDPNIKKLTNDLKVSAYMCIYGDSDGLDEEKENKIINNNNEALIEVRLKNFQFSNLTGVSEDAVSKYEEGMLFNNKNQFLRLLEIFFLYCAYNQCPNPRGVNNVFNGLWNTYVLSQEGKINGELFFSKILKEFAPQFQLSENQLRDEIYGIKKNLDSGVHDDNLIIFVDTENLKTPDVPSLQSQEENPQNYEENDNTIRPHRNYVQREGQAVNMLQVRRFFKVKHQEETPQKKYNVAVNDGSVSYVLSGSYQLVQPHKNKDEGKIEKSEQTFNPRKFNKDKDKDKYKIENYADLRFSEWDLDGKGSPNRWRDFLKYIKYLSNLNCLLWEINNLNYCSHGFEEQIIYNTSDWCLKRKFRKRMLYKDLSHIIRLVLDKEFFNFTLTQRKEGFTFPGWFADAQNENSNWREYFLEVLTSLQELEKIDPNNQGNTLEIYQKLPRSPVDQIKKQFAPKDIKREDYSEYVLPDKECQNMVKYLSPENKNLELYTNEHGSRYVENKILPQLKGEVSLGSVPFEGLLKKEKENYNSILKELENTKQTYWNKVCASGTHPQSILLNPDSLFVEVKNLKTIPMQQFQRQMNTLNNGPLKEYVDSAWIVNDVINSIILELKKIDKKLKEWPIIILESEKIALMSLLKQDIQFPGLPNFTISDLLDSSHSELITLIFGKEYYKTIINAIKAVNSTLYYKMTIPNEQVIEKDYVPDEELYKFADIEKKELINELFNAKLIPKKYMQYFDSGKLKPNVDVWSLGITIYQALNEQGEKTYNELLTEQVEGLLGECLQDKERDGLNRNDETKIKYILAFGNEKQMSQMSRMILLIKEKIENQQQENLKSLNAIQVKYKNNNVIPIFFEGENIRENFSNKELILYLSGLNLVYIKNPSKIYSFLKKYNQETGILLEGKKLEPYEQDIIAFLYYNIEDFNQKKANKTTNETMDITLVQILKQLGEKNKIQNQLDSLNNFILENSINLEPQIQKRKEELKNKALADSIIKEFNQLGQNYKLGYKEEFIKVKTEKSNYKIKLDCFLCDGDKIIPNKVSELANEIKNKDDEKEKKKKNDQQTKINQLPPIQQPSNVGQTNQLNQSNANFKITTKIIPKNNQLPQIPQTKQFNQSKANFKIDTNKIQQTKQLQQSKFNQNNQNNQTKINQLPPIQQTNQLQQSKLRVTQSKLRVTQSKINQNNQLPQSKFNQNNQELLGKN